MTLRRAVLVYLGGVGVFGWCWCVQLSAVVDLGDREAKDWLPSVVVGFSCGQDRRRIRRSITSPERSSFPSYRVVPRPPTRTTLYTSSDMINSVASNSYQRVAGLITQVLPAPTQMFW